MEHAPLDRTIINLRILGKVPPNARLRTNRNFIEHDQDTLHSYKRWRDREGRVNNRRALRELTDEATRFSQFHEQDHVVLEQLTEAMQLGKRGFVTLIETTYNEDETTKEILNRQLERLDLQIGHNRAILNVSRQRPRTQPVPIATSTTPQQSPRPSAPSSYKSPTTLVTPSPPASSSETAVVTTVTTTPPSESRSGTSSSSSDDDDEVQAADLSISM